jgi:hypothetical protein
MMRKVPDRSPGQCWLFTGAKNPDGYGNVRFFDGHKWTCCRAHAISARHVKRRKLPRGKVWRHTCDTPACINPAHLIPGTYRHNFWDMVHRGRAAEPFLGYKYRERDPAVDPDCPF